MGSNSSATRNDTAAKSASKDRAPELVRDQEAILAIFGLWKGRTDIPQDGLEYERQMRGQ